MVGFDCGYCYFVVLFGLGILAVALGLVYLFGLLWWLVWWVVC